MIKNILIILAFISAIFLLNHYYKQSSLKLNNHTIELLTKNAEVSIVYKEKNLEILNFSNLHVTQHQLTDNQGSVYYEEAKIEGLYQFNNIEEIIKIIFEAKEVKTIFSLNELIALQVKTKQGIMNLFVTDNDTKEIHFFYGLSNELFRLTILKLNGENKSLLDLKDVALLTKVMTHWSVLHNDFDGVISSIDY